jgi:hypothetical protein
MRRCAGVAQCGALAASQNSGKEAAVTLEVGPPDGEHPRVDDVQAPVCDPLVDLTPWETERQKLSPRDDPVLPPRKRPGRLLCTLPRHGVQSAQNREPERPANPSARRPRNHH